LLVLVLSSLFLTVDMIGIGIGGLMVLLMCLFQILCEKLVGAKMSVLGT
jgi:hypothetical protein